MIQSLQLICLTTVEGASSGIGKAVALACAARGAKVILGCRNQTKAEVVTARIKRKTLNDDVFFVCLDLSSLESVKNFVEVLLKQHPSVDILINNAGLIQMH